HDHGIDTQPSDDGEMLARYAIDSDLDQIDVPCVVPEGDLEGICLRQRDLEVPSQQVSSAQWYDGHRYAGLGQSICNDPDCPIAACRDDPIHFGRAHLIRDCRPWIPCWGFQAERVLPAARCGLLGDLLAEIVGRLDRVVDHCTAPP